MTSKHSISRSAHAFTTQQQELQTHVQMRCLNTYVAVDPVRLGQTLKHGHRVQKTERKQVMKELISRETFIKSWIS